jgi:hypothetical protein
MTAPHQFKLDDQAVQLTGAYPSIPRQDLQRSRPTATHQEELLSAWALLEDMRLLTPSGGPVAPRGLVDILDQVLDIVDDIADENFVLEASETRVSN